MTRVLVWKELREQGTILVALIVLGCAVLIAVSVLLETNDGGRATELRSLSSAGRLALVMLTLTAGVVVGGAMFAGEKEAGTFVFLDQLPASRWSVWWRKVVTGAVLVGVATTVLVAVAFAVGILTVGEERNAALGWVMLLGTVGYAAYGWGLFGSVVSRTSLGACGTGLAIGTLLGFLAYGVLGIALRIAWTEYRIRTYGGGDSNSWVLAIQLAGYLMIVVPIPLAAWIYTAPDRARKLADLSARVPGVAGALRGGLQLASGVRFGASARRLLWLTVRQLRLTLLALVGLALAAGAAFVPSESMPVAIWPAVSLFLGVLVGVVGVADEQMSAAFRFWGERRMPIGRLWLAKVVAGLAMLLVLLVVLLVPSVVAGLLREEPRGPFVPSLLRTGLFLDGGILLLWYLLVWPLYGFACGHLSALLFRKTVVASAVAIMTSGVLAAVWMPSFLAGGLHVWQVFVPVVGLLVTARLLAWPWATDRLGTRRPLVGLATGTTLVLLFIGGSLAYRVVEVPVTDRIEDDLRFSESLPSFDERQAGRDLRRAVAQFATVDDETRMMQPESRSTFTGIDREKMRKRLEVTATLDKGWPDDRPDLDQFLAAMFEPGWDQSLAEMKDKPIGVLEDPNELNFDTVLRNYHGVRVMTEMLLVRALRDQQRGNPTAVPEAVRVGLAVTRTARNKTLAWPTSGSFAIEHAVYRALDRWLENLDRRPDLLRAALTLVREHDRLDPFDPNAVLLAHQVVGRNLILGPSRGLPKYLDSLRPGTAWRDTLTSTSQAAGIEADLVAFAWAVPWEKERLRRVIGLGNTPGGWKQEEKYLEGAPGWHAVAGLPPKVIPQLEASHKVVLTARRAAMLKLAARLHEAETGKLPASLEELVPKYLPAVPADPYDGKPFRYRISVGETIEQARLETGEPEPKPPGFATQPLTRHEFAALAGIAGGVTWWPIDPNLPNAVGIPNEDLEFPVTWTGVQRFMGNGAVVTVVIPAGQGILWSIGPDRADNGGRYGLPAVVTDEHGDFVFLIPHHEKKSTGGSSP